MSSLLDYLHTKEREIKDWPQWKMKSFKDAFQLPTLERPPSSLYISQRWELVSSERTKKYYIILPS